MKKILLKSKLSEDEALKKLGKVSKDLLAKGLISKGDEIVAGVEEKDGDVLITINADLMTKDNYRNIKSKFLEVGNVLENDLKNFDDEQEGQDTNDNLKEKQEVIEQNAIKPSESILHDTEELLFNINPSQFEMGDLKTLLFSEEEIKNAPSPEEKRPADSPADEKKPEVKEHDAEGKEVNEDPKEEPKKPEVKEHDGEEVTLHSLLFSDDELENSPKEDPKEEPKKPEVKEHDGEDPKKEVEEPEVKEHDNEEVTLHSLLFSDDELENSPKEEPKRPVVKEHDGEDPKKECPFCNREEALKELAKCRRKESEGKSLTVAEKFFCDAASKHFSDEEVKKVEEPAKEPKKEVEEPKKEEPKKEVVEPTKEPKKEVVEPKKEEPKKEVEEPAKEESKLELLRRLNKRNNENSLLGRAKEINKLNK